VKHLSVLSAAGANVKSSYSIITRTAAGGGWNNHCKGELDVHANKILVLAAGTR